ncbi:flagellar motor switch phosphatase FliY [Lentibacillus salinarum]|uniref:Flagellar motor switch phosphatase FliY n=1 Tax=Lentibacillus salinarum TaxID=446820 RepID=A0ABW3ZQB5_9BACI
MNDGKLSQDEIDALLKVSSQEEEAESNTSELLSSVEKDTLGEIGNISFGSSATTLSTLLNQKVAITTPEVSIITKHDVDTLFELEQVRIYVDYSEGFNGRNILLMNSEDAAVIADIMLGGDGTSPDQVLQDIHLSAVQEVMNQMMGTAATSMSTVFEKRIDISPPAIKLETGEDVQNTDIISDEDDLVKVSFHLKVGNLIDSNIMQVIPLSFARTLVNQLTAPASTESRHESAVTTESDKPVEATDHEQEERTRENPQYLGNKVNHDSSSIQQAAFSDLEHAGFNQNEKRNLDMLLDIPLNVSVELGRTQRSIKDILELSAGSIVELDKLAGEPVDILVNQKLIAKGEVVVIDENFGVRVTDIVSQSDRLMKLK